MSVKDCAIKVVQKFVNRNPRNLELLGLQPRPSGYGMEKNPEKYSFIYKAGFVRHRRFLEGTIEHYKDGVVLTASSNEKEISSQLYSLTDISASVNVGAVLALRCAMSGIHFLQKIDDDEVRKSELKSAFYKALTDGGIQLQELPHIEHSFDNDPRLTYDNYEVRHTREDNMDGGNILSKD